MSNFGSDPKVAGDRLFVLEMLSQLAEHQTATVDELTAQFGGVSRSDLPPVNTVFREGTAEFALRQAFRVSQTKVMECLKWLRSEGWAECRSKDHWAATAIGRATQDSVPAVREVPLLVVIDPMVKFGNLGSKAAGIRQKVLGVLVESGKPDGEYFTWDIIEIGWSLRQGDHGFSDVYYPVAEAMRWLNKKGYASWRKHHPGDYGKLWKATEIGIAVIRAI